MWQLLFDQRRRVLLPSCTKLVLVLVELSAHASL
jgi:hypothetical protein